jgi:hypothetical protein
MKKLLTSLLFVTLLFSNHLCYARSHHVYINTTQETSVIFLNDARAETVRKVLEENPRIEQNALISSTVGRDYVRRNSEQSKKDTTPGEILITSKAKQDIKPWPDITHVLACNVHGCALCSASTNVTVETDKSKGGVFQNSKLYETRCINAILKK